MRGLTLKEPYNSVNRCPVRDQNHEEGSKPTRIFPRYHDVELYLSTSADVKSGQVLISRFIGNWLFRAWFSQRLSKNLQEATPVTP
jgi:hypothetical protein